MIVGDGGKVSKVRLTSFKEYLVVKANLSFFGRFETNGIFFCSKRWGGRWLRLAWLGFPSSRLSLSFECFGYFFSHLFHYYYVLLVKGMVWLLPIFYFFSYCRVFASQPTVHMAWAISLTFFLILGSSKSSCCIVQTKVSSSSSINSVSSELKGGGTLDGTMSASWFGALTKGWMYKEASCWSCCSTLVRRSNRSCCASLACWGIGNPLFAYMVKSWKRELMVSI